jgi:coatomer protein complex subunit gamma
MSLFVSDISDEFKSIVVDAVKTLCLKFPAKYVILLEFLGSVLREEGGYDYKRRTVEAICEILNEIPESRETGLAQLCEFIEDCEYPKLTAKIIQLIGSIGPESKNARELVRYIYNRLILESTMVRVACVGTFTKFAVSLKECREDIVNILRNKCCSDVEDDVRDRAIVSLQLISRLLPPQKLFGS